jgi:hypothetical protein
MAQKPEDITTEAIGTEGKEFIRVRIIANIRN